MLHQNRLSEEFIVHELAADDDGEPLSEEQLWEALTRTFQSPRYRPPMLPVVATELMQISSRADADVTQIVHLLEKDTLLAGRVLKLCNSPLYGAAEPIRSLKTAVVRLGLAELRDVVMEAAFGSRVFKTTGYSEAVDRVRVHSTAVAHLSRVIARYTSFESEYAFLCGLLHDVGLSAALVALGDVPKGEQLRPVADLWPALVALHETVGGSVATVWKLPAEVAMVLRLHHSLKVGPVVHPMAAIVTLAESIACDNGWGLVPRALKVGGATQPSLLFGGHRVDEPSDQQVMVAKAALGFEGRKVETIQAECKKVLAALGD
ncbi:MAG: HDOD domain-containing protein [Myxococcaceae bacterium]|nr:HDOD domain-containing protein [Myxococcaceae bacterium]